MSGEPRPVEIAVLQAPQDEPAGDSPDDPGDKSRSSGGVFLIGAGTEDFMQGAERQTAPRQGAVDRGDAERQHPVAPRIRPLDPADAVLQIDQASRR